MKSKKGLQHPKSFPEFLVFDKLEKNKSIMVKIMDDGRKIYLVKNDSDEVLLSLLSDEYEHPTCEDISQLPIEGHSLSNKDVAKWLTYSCYIAEALKIPLQQIMFVHSGEESGYSGRFITYFQDDMSVIEMLINIAHELRHAWQHIHHPEWNDNYIHPEDGDIEAYQMQISEVDAEAYGIKVESMITNINLLNTVAGRELDSSYRAALQKRMNEIDVVLSNKKINKIRKLIELDEIMKSITD